jgi:tyrosine-protein kinase Etk/Wzc
MDEAQTSRLRDDEEISLLDYWRVVRRRAWLIVGLCVIAVLLSLGYSLQLPKIYESTATILASPEGPRGGLGLASALAASGVMQSVGGLALPSLTPQRDMLLGLLKSRTMAGSVVQQFNLQELYEAKFEGDAIRRLQAATTVSLSKEGIISIKAEAIDPQLAADLANFYMDSLDRMVTRLEITQASKERAFISERMVQTQRELRQAEEALLKFQESHRAIALQEQARGAVEVTAQLRGEIMASEVQLGVMRNFATDANPEVVKLKRRIEEMKRHLGQMQYGTGWTLPPENHNPGGARSGESRQEIHVPVAQIPELGLELARLTRDVKVQETVYTLLTQQLEQAKIAEARDMPMVRVLDTAIPADRKAKPKIKLNMAIAGITSLFLGIFLAFFLEYLAGLKQSPHPQV